LTLVNFSTIPGKKRLYAAVEKDKNSSSTPLPSKKAKATEKAKVVEKVKVVDTAKACTVILR
jgi:hypothetical protein